MPSRTKDRGEIDPIEKAYEKLSRAVERLMDAMPDDTNIDLHASRPGGIPETQTLPPEIETMVRKRVLPALQAVDALIALERDPDAGVWETLVVEGHGHSRKAWISIVNAMGARERVTTFGTARGYGGYVAGWSAARSQSEDLGTSWDVARRERRVVDYGGEASLVDRGANRIVDILEATGREFYTTCEGHPFGAYAGFRPGIDAELSKVFTRAGWSVEDSGTIIRMAEVRTVVERDAFWRSLCSALEAHFGLESEADLEPIASRMGP